LLLATSRWRSPFSFLFGGGLIVLLFFFSLFWRWADEAERRILQRPSST
jgi:hypothetical protein